MPEAALAATVAAVRQVQTALVAAHPGLHAELLRRPEAALPALLAELRPLQAGLMAAHPGLRAALLRRPELRDGEVTVMESYAGGDPAAWSPALEQAVAARPALPAPRHAETFDEL